MKRFIKILLVLSLSVAFCAGVVFCVMQMPICDRGKMMMDCAKEILSGNLLLKGADLSAFSFFELMFYVVGVAIAGVGETGFYVATSLMYLFVFLSAVALAVYGTKRKCTAAAMVTAVGTLGLSMCGEIAGIGAFGLVFLTMLVSQIYNDSLKKYAVVLAGLITVLAVFSDYTALFLITVPMIILCLFKAFDKPFAVSLSVILGSVFGVVLSLLYAFAGKHQWIFLELKNSFGFMPLFHKIKMLLAGVPEIKSINFVLFAIFFIITAFVLIFAFYIVLSATKEVFRKRETDIPSAAMGIGMILLCLWVVVMTFEQSLTVKQCLLYIPVIFGASLARCTDIFAILKKRWFTACVIASCVLLTAVNFLGLFFRL